MASTLIVAGLGIAVLGYAGRYFPKYSKNMFQAFNQRVKTYSQPQIFTKYYNGGFEPKMNKREACLILGVSQNASKAKIKEAHRRVMQLNHPDRGGSPMIAAKINEAKDIMETNRS